MYFEPSIQVDALSKCHHIYDRPQDRLLQMLARQRKLYYREFWALRDVSFSLNPGETVGIIGRNGSGKSTLLQMICGTVTPTSGRVHTRGRVAALLELGAGFNIEFTGRENVLLNAAILGVPREQMESRMQDVLAFSELGDFLDQPVKTYSSGMYSRLAFSIAIHVDPDILIVDEALAVGDARFVAKCMRRIKDIQARGATILFVSHDIGSVRALCTRAIWLHKGRLLEDGDVFPVTGRFMAFMFKDAESEDDALFDAISAKSSTAAAIPGAPPELPAAAASGSEASPVVPQRAEIALDSRPVTHWGTRMGIILSAGVLNADGMRVDVHAWGAIMEVVVEVNVPADISRDHLSVAISIKDSKGSDLIVSTVSEFEGRRLPDEERFRVSFRLSNWLVTGNYLLVAAVENRQHRDIHYYEYVEGAHYFSSLADTRFFGTFQPPVELSIAPT